MKVRKWRAMEDFQPGTITFCPHWSCNGTMVIEFCCKEQFLRFSNNQMSLTSLEKYKNIDRSQTIVTSLDEFLSPLHCKSRSKNYLNGELIDDYVEHKFAWANRLF